MSYDSANDLCDWHRQWEPRGTPKCGNQATHNLDGYGGSTRCRFCCDHYNALAAVTADEQGANG